MGGTRQPVWGPSWCHHPSEPQRAGGASDHPFTVQGVVKTPWRARSCLVTRGRGGSVPSHQQPSSASRLLSASGSGAGKSTHAAQPLACANFPEWGCYLNQIREARKPQRQVQRAEEATRLEREGDNGGGSDILRRLSPNCFVKHPPPATAGCLPKGFLPATTCRAGPGLGSRSPVLWAN